MKNTNLKKMLIAFICLICFFTCYAQTIGEHYYLNSLTIRDGLSQNTVYDILQDKAGFMRFGTKDGLTAMTVRHLRYSNMIGQMSIVLGTTIYLLYMKMWKAIFGWVRIWDCIYIIRKEMF